MGDFGALNKKSNLPIMITQERPGRQDEELLLREMKGEEKNEKMNYKNGRQQEQ